MARLKNIIHTIKIITLSRIVKKTEKNDKWIKSRRESCKSCSFNTKNMIKIPLKKRILKTLSDLYSLITFNRKKDNLGNCTACESCSIYYKTREIEETCPKKLWK